MTKRCAIYTRKSTSEGLDREFNSLDAQREACEAYAKSQGWKLVPDAYDDGGFTGANIERPAFQRLLADVDAKKVDLVIVYKVDRLSRSLLDFTRVMDRFAEGGAEFVSVTQNFSTTNALGRLTLNMLMSFAEFEREMIAERTRDKIAAARRKGKWTGGPVPLGYDVIDRKLVVNDREAHVVGEVFALYEEERSALGVARTLAGRGRTMKRRPWTKDGVLRVLRNPVYAGFIPLHGELHTGEHVAIIERARYDRTQAALDSSVKEGAVGKNPDYLLRGLLRCSCGAAMTPAGSRGYRYYRCVRKDKGGKAACTVRPLPAPAIEEYVVTALKRASTAPAFAGDVAKRLKERLVADRAAAKKERSAAPKRIAAIASEVRVLSKALPALKGAAHRAASARLEALVEEQLTAEKEEAAARAKLAALEEAAVDAAWVVEALTNFQALWEVMTPHNRQRLVATIVDVVEVDEAKNECTLRLADLKASA